MAHPYVRGPIHIFVGTGISATPTYLGTGERAPRQSIRREFSPLFNDIGGVSIPFDLSFQGIEAFVTVALTRWNESVLNQIQDVVGNAGGQVDPGTILDGETGTLMMTENVGQPLWLQYSYGPGQLAPHAAMADMPPGTRYLCAFLQGPDELEGGTDPARVMLTWHCLRKYDPSTRKMRLFDRTLAGLPLPD